MQLIGRVFFLALCVFSAYSLPNTINLIHGKVSADDILNEIENIFTHYRGSNGSNSNNTNNNNTGPPNNNDTIINPPNNNSTIPPNNNDTIINPPNNNSTRPPNNNDTIINPPHHNNTRPPNNNNNDTIINPPNNNNTNNNDTNNNNNSTINVDLCFYKFTNQQNNHSQATIRRILSCFQLNNQSSIVNNTSLNSTVDEVNYSSYRLQFRLANCAAKDSNNDVFNCYVNSFDRNLEDLSDITEESALAADISAGNYSSLEIAQRACVSSAVIASKGESIKALNELESCVNSLGN